eukprot:1582720-Pyramimonas_sp.AAC.1
MIILLSTESGKKLLPDNECKINREFTHASGNPIPHHGSSRFKRKGTKAKMKLSQKSGFAPASVTLVLNTGTHDSR